MTELISAREHWCEPCRKWTTCEQEPTLPDDLKSGDPGYYDPDKCGVCGEFYQCQECGAPWDGAGNKCSEPERHTQGEQT